MATSSYYPDLGPLLQLRVRLNATMVHFGGAIKAEILLMNPLMVNLSAIPPSTANPTFTAWNGHDFLCGQSQTSSVFGYALFRGHYSSNNLTLAGNPLTLAVPVNPPCTFFPYPRLYVFLPHSVSALAYGSTPGEPYTLTVVSYDAATETCSVEPPGGTYCGVGDSLYGYWNVTGIPGGGLTGDNATSKSNYFHYFPPGPYTLVVDAAWGQQVIENFEVVSAP
jgi:hypothetical protein